MKLFSYLSLLACALYLDSGIRILRLAPKRLLNRLVFLTDLVLAFWAFDAIFSYAVSDPRIAELWYRSFAWTWSIFFSLVLHLSLVSAGKLQQGRPLSLLAIYLPGILAFFAHEYLLIEGFAFRGGYWMVSLRRDAWYAIFTAYNVGFVLAGIAILEGARRRARGRAERRRLGILVLSMFVAFLGGFLTDTIAVLFRLDFPNLGILWIAIWALGIRYAYMRYGLFAPLPIHAAREVMEALDDAIYYLDEEGRVVWANRAALGSAQGDALGAALDPAQGAVPGENRGDARGAARSTTGRLKDGLQDRSLFELFKLGEGDRALAEQALRGELGSLFVRANFSSSGAPAELYLRSLLLESPPLAGAIAAARDLSDRQRLLEAEESLAESDTLFGRFIEASLDAIAIADPEGRIIGWNRAMEELTGLPAAEARKSSMWEIQPRFYLPASLPGAVRSLERALETARNPGPASLKMEEFRIKDLSGREKVMQTSMFGIALRRGVAAAAVSRDVTAERRAQEAALESARRLDQAQKMEAVGSLTGGIAHDFNNILTGVLGTASYLRLLLGEGSGDGDEELREGLQTIERSAGRAAELVRHLLDLVRKRPREERRVRLAELQAHVLELTRSSRAPSVRLEAEEPPAEALVLGDAAQIEQLLLNLLLNAEESMTLMRGPEECRGGLIKLRVEAFQPDADFLLAYPQASSRPYWLIRVSDEGVGVPPALRERIFDPFFTTKGGRKSSGLGLSMVYTIARQHGGFVDFDSEPGTGSEFRVWLPAAQAADAGAGPERSQPLRLPRGEGRILVVDDEEIPRRAAAAILSALGYEAILAEGGEEALALYRGAEGAPLAVLLDLAMPGIDGRESLARLLDFDRDAKILISSGFASEELVADCLAAGAKGFIPKPYTAAELGAALANLATRFGEGARSSSG